MDDAGIHSVIDVADHAILIMLLTDPTAAAQATELIAQVFDDPKDQAKAVRWALRSLGVRHAICKV